MTSKVKHVPEGFHTVSPYLVVQGASKLVDFLKQSFQATEFERITQPDGMIMNAQLRIGDSVVMVSEARGGSKPMPASFYLYVPDTDAVYKSALQAGATSLMEPADQFYGNREAGVKDPFGNHWWIATHKEDVSLEEMQRQADNLFG